jgi:hypothetical protein
MPVMRDWYADRRNPGYLWRRCSVWRAGPFPQVRLPIRMNGPMQTHSDTRAAFVNAVVSDIQVAAGAAPYATVDELIDIFSSLADRIPDPATGVDQMVLRRLFAKVTFHIYRHAGADPPLRPVVNVVADADDPRIEFKAALAALRR